ncbi:chemotaxis protein CheW [Mariprofundus sp. KV]|uniref:hybrid sensor histidine kinase/response regulator n=1 Tax=Mariprofundus sp. KV TaxID=2608715 RepID=UPI0015A25128|nr:chemotaxis protein CheW [Mariprofundus sp. KV]NWF37102.1 response regulator [Mariprofundus sp. KV]
MDEELLAEFLTESNENLASIEQQLLDLEADPGNAEILDSIFRVVHTVKGSCGFLGLSGLEKVAHAGENLLGKIRSAKYQVDGNIVSLLLENSDAIKELIAGLEVDGSEPNLDYSALCERLAAAEGLIDNGAAALSDTEEGPNASDKTLAWLVGVDDSVLALLKNAEIITPEQVLEAGFEQLRALPGMQPAHALKILGMAKSSKLVDVVSVDKEPVEVNEKPAETAAAEEEVTSPVAVEKTTKVNAVRKAKAETSIRVDVSLLDELMNQVGELVLSRNRLLRLIEQSGDPDLVRTSRSINQITSRLQEKLLHTRMQPISTLWSTVPRLLRDITKQLGKKIRVDMEGQETELDRTILSALKDPMTHIIRNSCDHGIEAPEDRRQKGKADEGKITLSARQESGFIVINISDDGGGIDAAKIRDKAVSMDVITAEQAKNLSDNGILQLIFHAGLSTAEKVSNLSGRGVGMDVVRSEIESVGGTVVIDSELGVGTTLNIRIPLTLAIIPAMIVESSRQHFAVPQMMVQELIAIDPDSESWKEIAGKPFYMLRGRLLPIISLSEVMQIQSNDECPQSVVVVNIAERQFGISVNEVLGAEEIVVKPLGRHFNHLDVYGGCSILGDGRVVPILDCIGVTKSIRQQQDVQTVISEHDKKAQSTSDESQYILVFAVGELWYAIPMALVERIEEVDPDSIEKSGRREVLQYRDDVIQVIRLASILEVEAKRVGEVEPCLIISDKDKRLCIQVDSIVDIVKQKLEIHLDSEEPYFLGTAIVEGRSTEVVDILAVIKKVAPNWFSGKGERRKRSQKILYVEDAVFFRNLAIPLIEGLGCQVITARNGKEACSIIEREKPDLLLTDLEMPEMNGFELASWVRAQPGLQQMPIISLSSLDESEYVENRDLFNARVKKFDREVLHQQLTRLLGRKQDSEIGIIDAEVVTHQAIEGGGNS